MIHHFYHIFADGQWEQPVEEHIRALRTSGLLDKLTTFRIGMVGSQESGNRVINYLKEQGIFSLDSFSLTCSNVLGVYMDWPASGWEQVTQIPMHQFSKNNEGIILYAHTKGASNPSEVNIRWRRSMTYWNIIRWEDCISKLLTHGAVGCHWIQPLITGMPEHKVGNWMFAGTFFWTHCELMRTWQAPALTHRHEAEGFIGYGWHQSNFSVWDWTPYFPNSGPFADGWIDNPGFIGEEKGVAYG